MVSRRASTSVRSSLVLLPMRLALWACDEGNAMVHRDASSARSCALACEAGYAVEDLLTGLRVGSGTTLFGHLAGLAIDSHGAVVVAADSNGIIYRVTYEPAGVEGGVGDANSGD